MKPLVIPRVDPQFYRLIPPLTKDEFEQLEKNILSEGCLDPICVWKGLILDGHNRFTICMKYSISYQTREIHLGSRQEAIAWICANQLGRRNISAETRRYLIGKRYQAQKQQCKLQNLYKKKESPNPKSWDSAIPTSQPDDLRTSVAIGDEYQISRSTVENYGRYALALDCLAEKAQDSVQNILNGSVKLSRRTAVELSEMPKQTVQKALIDIRGKGAKATRRYFDNMQGKRPMPEKTIKDMPAYDPDAEVSSLTLTLPSWRGTLLRVINALETHPVTPAARKKLGQELQTLIQPIADIMSSTMKGKSDHAKPQ